MEKTSKFTIEISHHTYALLLKESRNREGSKGAVPSRTARKLIEERLEEINEVRLSQTIKQSGRGKPGPEPPIPSGMPSEQKSKKPKSIKRDVGADESTPTV